MITVERLRQKLAYNPVSGIFRFYRGWRKAGTIRQDGYGAIRLDGIAYYAHRLAWLYMTGRWPDDQLDHKDGNRSNNKWANLREAKQTHNSRNSKPWRKVNTLPKGVHRSKRRFSASITVDKRKVYLGNFKTPEEAHAAYCVASELFHKEFARTK